MSKKVKYIIAISLVVLLMLLGIATLIMALVPVGSNDAINLPNAVYIYTNLSGSESDKERGKIELRKRDAREEAKINKIFNLFNDGFRQQKALSAMFKGELGKGLEFVDNYTTNKSIDKYKDDDDHITIVFCYTEPQKVNNAVEGYNGYEYVCFTVTNNTELQDIILGLPLALNSEETETSSTSLSFQYSFEGKMVTSELYRYIYNEILSVHRDN